MFLAPIVLHAQTKNSKPLAVPTSNSIPISNAELGTFPYFKTVPNFRPANSSDSVTIEQNRVYFFDGKSYFTVDGQVSVQKLEVIDKSKKIPSELQLTLEFDKIVSTLGGKKIYAGKLPNEGLRQLSNADVAGLASKQQLAPNAYEGVVEYVIKTAEKEVWIQLVPTTLKYGFYGLLVVEKQTQLLTTNINKQNLLLTDLEKKGKAITTLYFDLDSSSLLTQSKDELLNIVGVFQAHADWKIRIEINNAPVGKPEYVLALTEQRAAAIKRELIALGVKAGSVEAKGMGDTEPLISNDTEKGRQTNTRVEIIKL